MTTCEERMCNELVQYIHRDKLRPGVQPRENIKRDESFLALARSIAEVGIIYPILARLIDGVFWIVDGHRRYFAGLSAKLTEFPVIMKAETLSESEALQLALIGNTHREDLSPWERACTYNRLITEFGLSAVEVAKRTATSEPTVSRYTTILTLPPELLDLFRKGKLSVSAAHQLANVRDPERQRSLAEAAASGKLSRDQLIKKANEGNSCGTPRTSRPRRSRVVVPLGDGCAVAVNPGVTLETLVTRLRDLLQRFSELAPQEMKMADVAELLTANNG